MGDNDRDRPDHSCLFERASEQHGYFTAEQARACGFAWDLLAHHARSGRFIRIRRGLYRLRDYPSSPREDVIAAWLVVGMNEAVVSHESALELLDLSDVVPTAIHLTVPRSKRHLPILPGVRVHTSVKPLLPDEIAVRDGIRLTAATRSILDAAQAGTAPEQIEVAIAQAVRAGLATPQQLRRSAEKRGRRVARLVASALDGIEP